MHSGCNFGSVCCNLHIYGSGVIAYPGNLGIIEKAFYQTCDDDLVYYTPVGSLGYNVQL